MATEVPSLAEKKKPAIMPWAAIFEADSAFDAKAARKVCFNTRH